MQRPLLHLNWTLEQEWLQPASSLLSPQSLSVHKHVKYFIFGYCIVLKCAAHKWKSKKRVTVVTAPVDIDAAAIGAGELSQREAGWVG